MGFIKAERKKIKLKVALIGPSGAGKSFSALQLIKGFGGTTAYVDTEGGRGELYADKFDYDILQLDAPFTPERFIEAIREAERNNYDNLIIDSASHEWMGRGGCLEIAENIKGVGINEYTKWGKVTPRHNAFVEAIVRSNMNIVFTIRGKDEYVMEQNDRGKMVPRKVGLGGEQRKGLEYECIVAFNLDQDTHIATATKDNTGLFNGVYSIITEDTGKMLKEWAESGKEPVKLPKVVSPDFKASKQNPESLITPDQIKMIWTIARGKENETLVRTILDCYGYVSSKEVKAKDFDKICNEIKSAIKTASLNNDEFNPNQYEIVGSTI